MTKAAYSSHKTQSKYFFSSSDSFVFCSSAILCWSVLIARVCFFISRYNYVITIMYSDYLKRNMLHKFMLQVWQYVFLIYFFLKFSFFSKNLFQQQQKISNRFEIFCCCWNKFFEKKMLSNKRKIPRDTQIFFMKLQQFEKSFPISWKSY